jgi:lysophospholipid acyltransferase (LPLAT)-like uncharacterized protein
MTGESLYSFWRMFPMFRENVWEQTNIPMSFSGQNMFKLCHNGWPKLALKLLKPY